MRPGIWFGLLAVCGPFWAQSPLWAQSQCPAEAWQEYKGTHLFRVKGGTAYFYSTSRISIDADGAPNAYHPQDIGIDKLANAGFPHGNWRSMLVVDPLDPSRPAVQKTGPFAGYYVSPTSLVNRAIKDETNPARYVDATRVPYLVFPGLFLGLAGTGRMGDQGISLQISSGKDTGFIVADAGNKEDPLGEVSIRMAEKLGGIHVNPRDGSGAPTGPFIYVVFPGTAGELTWPPDPAAIDTRARKRLSDLGGWPALQACLHNTP